MRLGVSALLLLTGLIGGAAAVRAEDAADRHFLERVEPLLKAKCVACHGPEEQSGGLRLDSREALVRGGENGPSVLPGEPEKSLLLHAVHRRDGTKAMPPDESLSKAEIAALERWIKDGAPWPVRAPEHDPGESAPADRIGDAWHDSRNPIVHTFGGERLDLWSFHPIRRVEPPATGSADWVRNPIDRFILSRLDAEGAAPAAEAERRVLARRVSFDLTGLPPAPVRVEAFVADDRPDAYERFVDELLASPRYGQHVARTWLDVVRYSDSNGFDWDEFRPQAWRFRDYVVRSFNADKPYDVFLTEQLAGDELLDGPPKTTEERDALIATGYLRLGPQDNSAPLFNEQPRARAELMADLVETTGSAMLGLTYSCCRCHDHKYDPLSQADHFRLRAFFEPVEYADDMALDLADEQEAIRRHNEEVEAEVNSLRKQRDELLAPDLEKLRESKKARLSPEERALLELPEDSVPPDQAQEVDAVRKKIEPGEKEVLKALSDSQNEAVGNIDAAIREAEQRRRNPTHGLLMTDAAGDVPTTCVLMQGDYRTPGEPVPAGYPSALDPNPAEIAKPANPNTKGRRLTLARWITSPENPFTARVMVNRVWQAHFGLGLVATPNDFGLGGAAPTHPELLDWLAAEFMSGGWSVKGLHRLIVTSSTYRQGLATDAAAAEQLYAGRTLRRLTAEQLRDSLLAASGLLNDKAGGPPVWPELPEDILQANPAFLDDNETKTKGWYATEGPERNARSLFVVQKRTVRVPFLETFDLPENATSCGRRDVSTVAPQALSLLNSPLASEAAGAFADRVRADVGSAPDDQIVRAFSVAFQREPSAEESLACRALLDRRGLQELCRALLNLNEFVYLD